MAYQQQHNQGNFVRPESEFLENVIQVNRVSKKTKGGNQIRFSVLVVVGDRKGKVGVGLGKAPDVLSSIKKAVTYAKNHFLEVPIYKTTIPYGVYLKYGAAKILLKPAPQGSGIIAGGPVRAVLDAAGIKDVVAKMLGSNNKITNVYAVMKALEELQSLSRKKAK
ncbi:MAG: 30S ribosomal protein S5 [bacterium]|nr:30S ribosomal protein S5 [bacterium]